MKSRAYTRRYLWYHRWLLVQHLVKPVADPEWSHHKIRLTHGRARGWRWWTSQFVSLVNSGWQERMSFSFRTVRPRCDSLEDMLFTCLVAAIFICCCQNMSNICAGVWSYINNSDCVYSLIHSCWTHLLHGGHAEWPSSPKVHEWFYTMSGEAVWKVWGVRWGPEYESCTLNHLP